jgi:toxin ParE1/3/4
MTLRFHDDALGDLIAIIDYGIENGLSDPLDYVTSLRARIAHMDDIKHPGRDGRVQGTREWILTNTPYIVVYMLSGETKTILRVLHGAQQWPA